MIVLDFSVRKSKQPNEAWLSQITDWGDLSDTIMEGDVQFSVNGIEFGVTNNFIIGVTDALVIGADSALFYEDRVWISYPEDLENLLFQRQGAQIRITSYHGRQIIHDTTVDALLLCREIGDFSRRVITYLFDEYPMVKENLSKFTECPHLNLRSYYYRLDKNPCSPRSFHDSFGDC